MTTIVTGATGFIGSVLIRKLLSQGRAVRAVVRSDDSSLNGLDIDVVKADIRNYDALPKAFRGAESVFHMAAEIALTTSHAARVTATNVNGAENVALAALEVGVKRYVHCSSIHTFDLRDPEQVVSETTQRVGNFHPLYDRTKSYGERAVRQVVNQGLPAVIIHPSGVIGPGDHRPSRIGQLLLDLTTWKFPFLIQGGFTWVDVRDVCDGAIAAEAIGRAGESYILSGAWHSVRELAEFGEEITGISPPPLDVPMPIVRTITPLSDFWGWVTRSEPRLNSASLGALRATHHISYGKAQRELGYNPRSIQSSVHDAYHWFANSEMLRIDLP